MPEREYILFCDESERAGRFYSNFYGGLLVPASHYQQVTAELNKLKAELNLFGEIKWEKVTRQYLDRYVAVIRLLFAQLREGRVRIRIMFRQNVTAPVGLTERHRDNEYFLLYYQFLKHGFQLASAPRHEPSPFLRLYFDQFPDTKVKVIEFRHFLMGMLRKTPFQVREQDLTEVRSHDHVLLQCLDIVMGAMAFRLNDKHKEKIPGTRRRGKRTRAKEELYRVILQEIHTIRPRFNIGVSTGSTTWGMPYAHWRFVPKNSSYQEGRTKHAAQKANPDQPT